MSSSLAPHSAAAAAPPVAAAPLPQVGHVHPIVAAAVLDGRHVEAARLNHLVGVGEFSGNADGLSERWRARLTEDVANRMRGADPELTTINEVLAYITKLHGAPFVEKHEVTQQHSAHAFGLHYAELRESSTNCCC
jgi:hypothetical protein